MASRPNSVDYARFVREHVETCFNRDEWEDAERFYRPDIVVNHPAIGEPVRGIAAFRGLVNTARTGFPDVHWEVVDVFGGWDGDREKTAVRFRVTGTHTGDFVGFPARAASRSTSRSFRSRTSTKGESRRSGLFRISRRRCSSSG